MTLKKLRILAIILSLLFLPSINLVSQEFKPATSNDILFELTNTEQILIHKIELIGAWLERKSFENWIDAENPFAKLPQYSSFESTLPKGNFIYIVNNDSVLVWESGLKLAVLTKNKITAPGRITASEVGNKVINGNKLIPNMKYDVDGFIYQTDSNGLVKTVSAKINNTTRIRLDYQQSKSVKIKDGLLGDQGGHLIAARFFGPGEQINVVPMSDELNLGRWKMMENSWAEAFNTNKLVDINVEMQIFYEGSTKRPIRFEVQYKIGSGDWIEKEFLND